MKKEKFISSTIILIIGGFLTKILGMVIRIVMTRIVKTEGISLYILIFPTFSLFMTISQLGFPIAISKLVAEDKYNNKKVVFSIIPFSLILNLILMIIIFILAKPLAFYLLKDERCYYPILSIAFVLPFDSLSSILRGYFFGKQKMLPHVISNIFEQIIRLILIILIVPSILDRSLIYAVSSLVLVNVFSELSSIIVLFFFIPKNFKIKVNDIKPDINNIKDILRISIPTTVGRIIGSIGYFLEPIIIASTISLSNTSILKEYGIIEGYVMPLLLLPSFFSNAISSALIPVISREYSRGNIKYVKRKIIQGILISLAIGITVTLLLFIYPELALKTIYKTKEGANYIRVIAPFVLIYYIQTPLASVLQSINKSKSLMIYNIISIIIRSIILFIGCIFMGIQGFLIAMCSNILLVTYLYYIKVKNTLK